MMSESQPPNRTNMKHRGGLPSPGSHYPDSAPYSRRRSMRATDQPTSDPNVDPQTINRELKDAGTDGFLADPAVPDDTLAIMVRRRIKDLQNVDASGIEVTGEATHVELRGQVRTQAEKDAIVAAAGAVEGVTTVRNDVRVSA